jgi:hypothetical protein
MVQLRDENDCEQQRVIQIQFKQGFGILTK